MFFVSLIQAGNLFNPRCVYDCKLGFRVPNDETNNVYSCAKNISAFACISRVSCILSSVLIAALRVCPNYASGIIERLMEFYSW